jgi:hypothetical protein
MPHQLHGTALVPCQTDKSPSKKFGHWRLILPRTFEAEGALKTIPSDNYLRPDLEATLQSAQPMLYDLQADPNEENNMASDHPEMVAALRTQLDAHWTPKIAVP